LRPIVYDLRAGAVAPADALRIVVSLLGRWRGFPTVDPDLPRESLPIDWPRREARRLFVEVYDACIPLAAMYVRSVISRFDPATADMVRGLSVAKSLEHYRAQVAITEEEPDLSLVGPRLPHPTY
jgi:phenylacetic acid degradation operon negative regulatory protein